MKLSKKSLSIFLAVSTLVSSPALSGASAMFGGTESEIKQTDGASAQTQDSFISCLYNKTEGMSDFNIESIIESAEEGDVLFWLYAIEPELKYFSEHGKFKPNKNGDDLPGFIPSYGPMHGGTSRKFPVPDTFDKYFERVITAHMRERYSAFHLTIAGDEGTAVAVINGGEVTISRPLWKKIIAGVKARYREYWTKKLPHNVSEIFVDEPETYGSRGDVYLWCALQDRFDFPVDFSVKPDDFGKMLNKTICKLCHIESLEFDDSVYVPEFDRGGMSGGRIDKSWWREIGIPMLVSRYEELWKCPVRSDRRSRSSVDKKVIPEGSLIKPKGVSDIAWDKLFGLGRKTVSFLDFNGVSYRVPYLYALVGGESKLKFDNFDYKMSSDEREALLRAFRAHVSDKDLSNWEVYKGSNLGRIVTEDSHITFEKYIGDINKCVVCIQSYLEKEKAQMREYDPYGDRFRFSKFYHK